MKPVRAAWRRLATASCTLASAAAAAQAPAAGPAPPAASAPSQRIVVEGRGDDAEQRRRAATAAMQVVGRDELDAHGDTSLLDVLQRVPGITIEGESPRLRGMGAGYTQILLNGEPAPPGFSLDQLAPGDIERIEIVKGPSAEFGGAAGTINVILRQPPRSLQRELRGSLGHRAVRPQGWVGGHWGDRVGGVSLFVPLSVYTWANGHDVAVDRVSRGSDAIVRVQRVEGRDESVGRGFSTSPRMDWKIDEVHALQWQGFAQASWHENTAQRQTRALQGPAPSLPSDASAAEGDWQMQRGQLQWLRKTPEGSRLELKASGQGSRWRQRGVSQGVTPAGLPGSLRESIAGHRERTAMAGLRWRQPWAGSHALNLGADAETRSRRELNRRVDDGTEQRTGTWGRPVAAQVQRMLLFVQDEWTPDEQASLTVGLRAEGVRTRFEGFDAVAPVSRWDAVTPILQWRQAFDAQGRRVLRASVAQSVRAPELGLLLPRYSLNGSYDRDTPNTPIAADSAGNPALQPERILALELHAERTLAGGGALSAGLFHRELRELIRRRIGLETVPEATVPRWVSRPVNLGRARSSGLELEVKGAAPQLLGPVWAAAPKALQLRAGLSLFRSSVEQVDDPDARLEGQPPWRLTLGLDHRDLWPGWTLGASLGVTPAFSTQQTDRQRVWRSASQRLDGYLLWRIERHASLRLAVQHLAAADARSSSQVQDLDGFTARSETRRGQPTQVSATLQWRL